MNIVRNPESQRGPQLARRAKATAEGMRVRGRRPVVVGPEFSVVAGPVSTSSPSPWLESTRSGNRIAQIVATTKMTKA